MCPFYRNVLLLFAALALAASTEAHEYKFGSIQVVHPWAMETLPGAKTGTVFLKIVNNGRKPIRFLGASTPAADSVQIHSMSIAGGVMRMRKVAGRLMVPPRGHLKFKSSGLHLMLLGLKAPLVAEEMVPVTLKFDKGVNIDIELYIEVSAAPEDDHTH